jgi:hypothetical protein
MMRAKGILLLGGMLLLNLLATSGSQAAVSETDYAGLHWRQVGPFRGGWATAVAGHPDELTTFYFGSADGGVWKTDDAGSTWRPLFEQQGSASILAMTCMEALMPRAQGCAGAVTLT